MTCERSPPRSTTRLGPFGSHGITAWVGVVGPDSYLAIADRGGQPLSVAGTAVGNGPGQLDLRRSPRDTLGLCPSADQVTSGFANFFGLNDIFVADPTDAFDSKAPTGIFTSTATAGTARALVLNPTVRDDPSRLGDTTMARQIADLLCGTVNVAAAGGMERANVSLAQYATKIVASVSANTKSARSRLTFQQTLLDGLTNQQAGMANMDMNDTLTNLTTLQQAYHDLSQVISSMSLLVRSLGVSVH